MTEASYSHNPSGDNIKHFRAAALIGEMVANGQMSDDGAQYVLDVLCDQAAKAAPQRDASGLRARLVWTMRDQVSDSYLASIRAERRAVRDLTDAAEVALRAGRDPVLAVIDAALAMENPPHPKVGAEAIANARWRVKNKVQGSER